MCNNCGIPSPNCCSMSPVKVWLSNNYATGRPGFCPEVVLFNNTKIKTYSLSTIYHFNLSRQSGASFSYHTILGECAMDFSGSLKPIMCVNPYNLKPMEIDFFEVW